MVYPPPGFACTTSREGSKDAERFQAPFIGPSVPRLARVPKRGSVQLQTLIHLSAWKVNSPKFGCGGRRGCFDACLGSAAAGNTSFLSEEATRTLAVIVVMLRTSPQRR